MLRVLQVLGDGSGNRGNELVNLFCEIANVDALLCTTIRVVGARAIDQMISNVIARSPQVLDLLTAISDLVTILNRMTIIGEFEFLNSFPDNDGWLRGNETVGIQLGRLPQGGNNCDRSYVRRGSSRPRWSGSPHLFPLRRHRSWRGYGNQRAPLTVKYGLIILGRENWVIPQVTDRPGPIPLSQVLATLPPCEAIDCYWDNQGRCDVGFCEDILVTGLTDVIVAVLMNWFARCVYRSGTVRPVDTDGDDVDLPELVDGQVTSGEKLITGVLKGVGT